MRANGITTVYLGSDRVVAYPSLKHYHPDPDHTPDGYREDDEPVASVEQHPLWERENVILMSVGIDIGSAGTQVLFSRVHLRRQSVDLSTRYLVIARDTLYESPVSLTPYAGDTLIDARKLGEIVDDAYNEAAFHPRDIDTGVVLLTGEALRRENAAAIARVLSEKCGDLVCAAAGHHMEATLAAHGSGAVHLSADRALRILNIDIGGGTTKLSVVDRGHVRSTAALHIGSRLLAVDEAGVIERLEPAGRAHALRAGFDWRVGDSVTEQALTAVAESMADDLVAALTVTTPPAEIQDLYLTDPIAGLERIDALLCSGGVAEYVYRRESRDFGDLGRHLGRALAERVAAGALPWPLLADSRGIRSTALGCAEFTTQLSGNTIYISDAARLLPRRNLRVLRPVFDFVDDFDPETLAAAVRRHLARFEIDACDPRLVLAFHWDGSPRYRRLRALADGIVSALEARIERDLPLYIVIDADIGMSLGAILRELSRGRSELFVADGLELWDFDSIDIGMLREPSMTVPVTIKSLIFGDVTDGTRPRELVHHAPELALAPSRSRRGA